MRSEEQEFVTLPVTPTEAMLRPFYECPPDELGLAWSAMLAVAKNQQARARAPDAGEAEAVAAQIRYNGGAWSDYPLDAARTDTFTEGIEVRWLYTHPAPRQQYAKEGESERQAFEAWAAPILGDNPTWRESGDCELAWQAWQAAPSHPPATTWDSELGVEWPAVAVQAEPVWCDACSQMVSDQCPSGMCEMKKGVAPERQDPLSRTREEHSPGLAMPIVRWKNLDAAMGDPLFQALRGIMGTANYGQDDALFRVLSHFEAAHPKPAAPLPLELSADDIRAIRNSVEGPKGYTEGVIRKAFEWGVETARSQPAAPATADEASDEQLTAVMPGDVQRSGKWYRGVWLRYARRVLALRSGASAQHAEGGAK